MNVQLKNTSDDTAVEYVREIYVPLVKTSNYTLILSETAYNRAKPELGFTNVLNTFAISKKS